jgi:hypothetical protein
MPLIDKTTLLGIADRAARQYEILNDAFAQAQQEGGGWYFDRVSQTGDPDIEIPTGLPYQIVDNDLLVDASVKNGTQLQGIIGAMEVHFNTRTNPGGAPLQPGGWDGYLAAQNVRVSWWFNKLFHAVKDGRWMRAVNVFSETDDLFGEVTVAAGPSVVFTDGVNYGTGAPLNYANGSNFAATQLHVQVVSMGSAQVDLRLSVKNMANLPVTIDVTIPPSSPPGTLIPVGTSADRYLDLIGASFVPAGNVGTLGDSFEVRNLKERQIAL